jgi:hypothetical protein
MPRGPIILRERGPSMDAEVFMPKDLRSEIKGSTDPERLKERVAEKLGLTESELSILMDEFGSEEKEEVILGIISAKRLTPDDVKMYGLPTELYKKRILTRQEAEWLAGRDDA